jgi:hypothetical protein
MMDFCLLSMRVLRVAKEHFLESWVSYQILYGDAIKINS